MLYAQRALPAKNSFLKFIYYGLIKVFIDTGDSTGNSNIPRSRPHIAVSNLLPLWKTEGLESF